MSATLVTAFFDINREKNGDGRKIEEYLKWIKKTLQLNCNLFIITEKKFINFMRLHRPRNYNTFIKEETLENTQYYKYFNRIKEILSSNEYKRKIQHPNRVECILPEYNIIQYNKFYWLEDAIKINPFHSEYFFWVDAGISRFFLDVNINNPYPNMNIINKYPNKLIIQSRYDLKYSVIDDNFIWKSDNLIKGTMFGGDKNILLKINKEIEKIFIEKMLKNNNVNNEQIALTILYKNNSELFQIVDDNINCHLIIFKLLSL